MPDDGVRRARAGTGLLAGVPLRVRLVAVACCLTAVGAGIITLACGLTVRDGLMWQADQQLRACAGLLASGSFTIMPAGPGPCGAGGGALIIEVASGGRLVVRTGQDPRPGPALAQIPARAEQFATVRAGSGGGSWLVACGPVNYSAQHIPFTYGYDDFSVKVTSTARPGTPGRLVVGLDLSSVSQATTTTFTDGAAAGVAAVLAVAVLGLAAIRALLRPLAHVEAMAAAAIAHRLSRQVPDDTAGRSAEHLRSDLVGTCRELRRSVSIIGGLAGYYHQRGPLPPAGLDRMMGSLAEETARMDALIDHLEHPAG